MLRFLTKSSTLWVLFALFLLETALFGLVMAHWDFVIIDEMYDPEHIRNHVAQMSDTQRHVHAWMTATLDVAYPLTYGPLFIGLALKRFPFVFALPAMAVMPTDLAEGFVQVMLLLGDDRLIGVKAMLTPTKLLLFILAVLIALASLGVTVLKRMQRAD